VAHTQADVSRARRVLGWEARTDLAEGLRLTRLSG
jgi:nucleoside-diphosphate-sugar epimerase